MTANALNGFLHQENKWPNQQLEVPLKVLILNLMPTKRTTERQFLTLLDSLQQDVAVTFMYPRTHRFKNTDGNDVRNAYCCLDQICNCTYDGLIITGSPLEQLDFKVVDYWDELVLIRQWAQSHVKETINECWASQAALYDDFQIQKQLLKQKLFGIYQAQWVKTNAELGNGLKSFINPQSRYSGSDVDRQNLPKDLEIVIDNLQTGPMILQSVAKHQTYVTGHPEYDRLTLDEEYRRDLNKGHSINAPENYYVNDQVQNTWRISSRQLYQNWLNLITSEENNYDKKSISF